MMSLALWLAAVLALSVCDALADAPLSFALDEGESVEIGAQGDITWSEVHHSLTARKSAFVAQGAQRVDADTIFFFFADDTTQDDMDSDSLQLSSMDAAGEVHIQSIHSRATAQRANYDATTRVLTLYADEAEEVWLYFPDRKFELTAKQQLVYDDIKGQAHATGGTLFTHHQFTLHSDELIAFMTDSPTRAIAALRANQGVILRHPQGQLRGRHGVYDLAANVVTMSGDVRLISDGKEFAGDYGIFNLRTGISRLISFAEAEHFSARYKAPIQRTVRTDEQTDSGTRRPTAVITINPRDAQEGEPSSEE